MYKVAIITAEQANELKNKQCFEGCYFNPVQDANNNWVISEQEIQQSDIGWLKILDLIAYQAKQIPNKLG